MAQIAQAKERRHMEGEDGTKRGMADDDSIDGRRKKGRTKKKKDEAV